MQMKRPGSPAAAPLAPAGLSFLVVAAAAALAVPQARAVGIGSPQGPAVMGQPLNLGVPLRLEAGEVVEPRCISAEVTMGDRRLPVNAVGTVIEPTSADTARVRIQTLPSVDEPVVSVVLHVGCQSRVTRRFVVLADPPGLESPAPALALAPPAPALPMAPAQEPPSAAPAGAAAADGATQASAPARRPDRARGQRAQSPQTAARPTTARVAGRPAGSAAPAPKATAGKPAGSPGRGAQLATAAAPRLKLDSAPAPDTPPAQDAAAMAAVEQAIRAVAEAASAVRAANDAASAAELRAQGLERSLAQQRAENQTQREAMGLLRERMASSEAVSNWVWPLLVGLAGLGALAGWLAWQLAALRREQRLGWQQAAQAGTAAAADGASAAAAGPASPMPFVIGARPAAPAQARNPATPAWPPPAPPVVPPPLPNTITDGSFVVSTQPSLVDLEPAPALQRGGPQAASDMPPQPEPVAPRDLSIEELIDLEQQAEFFVVLGQDDAAIDLLVEHVRSTGGGSPLPYLKLLEIYHRLGDREAYERTRTRFNQRFNAYAAEWSAGLLQGRSLEDYPDVLPRLTHAWPQPLDAMAELESLLFRKTHGELFDLPAYREVLFLYALARDLLDREAADTGNVDLLLPLADGGDFGATLPHPYFGLDHDSVFDRNAAEDRPTSPVDLDLSQGETPKRIFDPLAARPPQP